MDLAKDGSLQRHPKPCRHFRARRASRRKKLLQFHDSIRPAYYGRHAGKSVSVSAVKPFALDSALNYEVDSDDEWGEEPEDAEELSSNDEAEEKDEDSSGAKGSSRLRSDGLEEDDEFLVPEDEDLAVYQFKNNTKLCRLVAHAVAPIWSNCGQIDENVIELLRFPPQFFVGLPIDSNAVSAASSESDPARVQQEVQL